jgi:hypothetical protein
MERLLHGATALYNAGAMSKIDLGEITANVVRGDKVKCE